MNIRRITAAAAAMLVVASMLSACGRTAAPGDTEVSSAEVAEETTVKEPETPEEFHEAMVKRSLYSLGNPHRLKAKIEQAKSGEKTTVAYIGGSITEGYTVRPNECYAKVSYDWFCENYGNGDNVEYVNAGLSGTPSNLGNIRLQRDILSHEPDIVFVEFAVNDGQDSITKESYESLVKTVISQENEPAVVLLFNRTDIGYTAQDYMKQIGTFYDLPMISTADALTPELDAGRIKWEDNYNDGSHPSPEGHMLFREFIANMYTEAEKAEDTEYSLKPGGVNGTPYENTVMITPEADTAEGIEITECGSFVPSGASVAGFPTSWKYDGGNEPMKLNVHASAFFMVYKRNKSDSMGAVDVYLNGEKLTVVNSNDKDGWGEAYSTRVIKFQNVKDMEIEIRPAEGSEGKNFDILGLAYAANESFL